MHFHFDFAACMLCVLQLSRALTVSLAQQSADLGLAGLDVDALIRAGRLASLLPMRLLLLLSRLDGRLLVRQLLAVDGSDQLTDGDAAQLLLLARHFLLRHALQTQAQRGIERGEESVG